MQVRINIGRYRTTKSYELCPSFLPVCTVPYTRITKRQALLPCIFKKENYTGDEWNGLPPPPLPALTGIHTVTRYLLHGKSQFKPRNILQIIEQESVDTSRWSIRDFFLYSDLIMCTYVEEEPTVNLSTGTEWHGKTLQPVFRIRDILVRYGSGSSDPYLWLTDPDAKPLLFSSVTFKTLTKYNFSFLCIYAILCIFF